MTAQIIALVWKRFICRACGLIYDEAKGDADSGIAPGTRFDDIPDDWSCPLCGVTKADFEPYEEAPLPRRAAGAAGATASPRGRRADAGVVIVGAGRAGWQMAEALRERDPDLPIAIVSACDAAVYDKPQLSVAFAKGLTAATLVKEGARTAADRLGVRLLANTAALGIVATARLLRTTRGSVPWRHLILAHGAAPRAMPQLPASLCWRINHLDTYLRFRAAIGKPSQSAGDHILIAGAGLVGCELANDIALAGHRVALLDIEERPLAALLDVGRSRQLLEAWQGLPLRFEGGVRICRVERAAAGALVVAAEDGRRFETMHMIAATGLETPSRLAESAGLAWNNGIAVDPVSLATSVPDIHALGDCISLEGRASRYIEPIARQARVIADRITGRAVRPYVAIRQPVRVKTTSFPLTA